MEQSMIETLLCTADEAIAAAVSAAGAAVECPIVRVRDAESLIARWRDARVVLVGADLAVAAGRVGLPVRQGVYVLGDSSTPATALSASVALGAATIVLPEGGACLADVLSGRTGGSIRTSRICVLGGSGGVGASTLAVGLATAGTSLGQTALVDLDPLGGGLDLLLGAERVSGWRWDKLRSARGQIGELAGHVPASCGMTLVSMGRDEEGAVPRDAVAAVLASLARSTELVVMDVGRSLDAGAREGLRGSDRTVLVCAQDVRGVASARMTLSAADVHGAGVVVRLRPGGTLRPAEVAAAVGLPLLGSVPVDNALASAAERGVPPDRAAGRGWIRACASILGELGTAATEAHGRVREERRGRRLPGREGRFS
ncbi:MAG TPA: septum site-determining protein Ssd [Propionibacteriaceae bacterium]|nr:septum site-determining protein Ssd [Propionibacteriaceae bacterium]